MQRLIISADRKTVEPTLAYAPNTQRRIRMAILRSAVETNDSWSFIL